MTLSLRDVFAADYDGARALFRAAAGPALLDPEVNAAALSPKGGALAADLAWFGPRQARTVFVCTSGMHGFEGPAGSAAQIAWIKGGGPGTLPDGVAVLLVHALNPWGFAHVSRLTENNVDLNRNFLDWDASAPPPNPYYRHVRDLIRVPDLSGPTLMRLLEAQKALVAELGPAAAQVAVDFGQYEDAQGITFGGAAPEFGHRVMRDRVVPLLAGAEHVGLLDWHTGVGAYNEIAILPLDGPGSENAKRVARWWGRDLVENWKRSEVEAQIENDPNIGSLPILKTGQMKQALRRWLPGAEVSGAVVEFGTARDGDMTALVFVTLYERWLRFEHAKDGRGGDRMAPEHAPFREMAKACFVPDDPVWRATVMAAGPRLMRQAIAGLAEA